MRLNYDLFHLGQIYNVKKIITLMNIKNKMSYCFIPQCVIKTQHFPRLFYAGIQHFVAINLKLHFDLNDKQVSYKKNQKRIQHGYILQMVIKSNNFYCYQLQNTCIAYLIYGIFGQFCCTNWDKMIRKIQFLLKIVYRNCSLQRNHLYWMLYYFSEQEKKQLSCIKAYI